MDKKTIAHEFAMVAAKTYVDSNKPDYIHRGTKGVVEDMVKYYSSSYDYALELLEYKKPSMEVLK